MGFVEKMGAMKNEKTELGEKSNFQQSEQHV